MKTNHSRATTMQTEPAGQSYQQFPAQAARIPTSHSQINLDTQYQSSNNHISELSSKEQIHNPLLTSPHLSGLSREASWPVEGFGDLHLSASEPRMFPGLVSRKQRKDSVVRKSSQSETDDLAYASGGTSKRGAASSKGADGKVDEEEEEEASDYEMEEAGGSDT